MSRATNVYKVIPWVGGLNDSIDPGVLNDQELVVADNVQFSESGARIKRNAFEYIDPAVPVPDFRSSSGTTRTLKWTTNPLVNITSLNERLVVSEQITVSGVTNYNATGPVLTRNEIPQVTEVVCVADVAGSLNNKYFLISAGDDGTDFYVWFNVNAAGVDPALTGKTPVVVALSTDASAATVATAVASALDALTDFAASAVSTTVTVTNSLGGVTTDASAGNSGVTVTITTKGGHSITYTGTGSLSESLVAAGALTVERASSIICAEDYWRFTGTTNDQLEVYATNNFQLFKLDGSGRRVQILGQLQSATVLCDAASTLTTGDYFLLNTPNSGQGYYVWYNKDSGGGDPVISGRTAIPVAVAAADTAGTVATATQVAINATTAFSASVDTATVTVTNEEQGIASVAVDGNTGFVITTLNYGATAPSTAVSTVKMKVFQNELIIAMSGLGNEMITYNPEVNARYRILSETAPDASIIFEHQGRLWANDKTDPDKLHYCETFNQSLWGGIGDSGALFVGPGDGDEVGLTNGYKYKDFIVVGKKARRYRVDGDSPENYQVNLISEGMGNEGALAVPVDETDVIFISKRGIHSQQATDAYGDTDAAYLSNKVKKSFNSFSPSRLKYSQGAYIPELNSVAFSVAEEGQNEQNAVWLYNVEVQLPNGEKGAWYRWPDVSCQSLSRRRDNDTYKLVFGTSNGRLIQAQNPSSFTDFETTGISYRVKTGTIYPDSDPQSIKAFKRITLFYRPKGNFTFVLKTYIDNLPAQAFAFNQISGLDLLGETFVLGNSILGSSATLAPFTFILDGIGRGIVLEIVQPSEEEQIEVWGFGVEFEPAEIRQETE